MKVRNGGEWSHAVSATAGPCIPGDNNRVSITFTGHNGGRVTYSTQPGPVIDATGITMQIGSTPFTLTREEYGDLVGKPWFAVASASITASGFFASEIDC